MKLKRGDSNLPGLLVVIIVLVIVMAFLIIGIRTGVFDNLKNYWVFIPEENHYAVVKHCELLCTENNATMFCNDKNARPLPLSLGNKRIIEGSCAALSDVGLPSGFDSIGVCPRFDCSGYAPAVCKIGSREIPCNELTL